MQNSREKLQVVYRWLMAILIFILPLKFSQQYLALRDFSADFWTIFFINWPPVVAFFLVSLGALCNSLLYPSSTSRGRDVLWLWGGLLIALIPSAFMHVQTYEWLSYFYLLFSALLLSWQINRWLANDPRAKNIILVSLASSTCWLILWAWWQRPLGGLAYLENYTKEHARLQQITIEPGVLKRLHQRRAYGPFGYPNVYAAYLLLTGPVTLFFLWQWLPKISSTFFKKVSASFNKKKIIFLGKLTVAFLGFLYFSALVFSESRTVFPALLLAGGITYFCWGPLTIKRKKNIVILLCGFLILSWFCIYAFSLITNRDPLATLYTRFGYWRGALLMFSEHPWLGVGWGEFYPNFMRLKEFGDEMARTPHSFIFKFSSQCGILGLLSSCLFIVAPIYFFWRQYQKRTLLDGAIFIGVLAFLAHSLADFNFWFQSPILILAIILPLLIETDVLPALRLPIGLVRVGVIIIMLATSYCFVPVLVKTAQEDCLPEIKYANPQNIFRPWQVGIPLDFYYEGLIWAGRSHNSQALSFYLEKLIQQAPNHAWLMTIIAQYIKENDLERAIKLLHQADFWGKGDEALQQKILLLQKEWQKE